MLTPEQQAINAATWIKMLQLSPKLTINARAPLKQFQGALGSPKEGFCCLGFGCWLNNIKFLSSSSTNVPFMFLVGLRNEGGTCSMYKDESRPFHLKDLIALNDVHDWSFKAIGDNLRKYYRFYFIEEVTEWLDEILPEMDGQDFITNC